MSYVKQKTLKVYHNRN